MDIYEMLRAEAKAKKAGEPVKEQYGRISVDLSTARTDEELHISGNQITIAQCDGGATTTYFKLNSKHSRKVYPAEITKVLGNFGGVFLTNAAEPGKTLTIYLGRDIFIFPARAEANRILKADGTTINPVRDERHQAHKPEVLIIKVGADFAADKISSSALKIKWAIIYNDLLCYIGVADVSPTNGLPIAAESYTALDYVDLSELYVVGNASSTRPQLNILYIEEAT